MKHEFTVIEELDTPVAIAVAAYLDCEHYLYLHKSMTTDLEILKHEGRQVTVKQSWRWFGLKLGHIKVGEYIPPNEFLIHEVKPAPWWIPSVHHIIDIKTHLKYFKHPDRNTTVMWFKVELKMPFFLAPLKGFLQRLIEKMHKQQNIEDLEALRYRAKLFGYENNSAYLAPHQFLYHKDDYVRCFGPGSVILEGKEKIEQYSLN